MINIFENCIDCNCQLIIKRHRLISYYYCNNNKISYDLSSRNIIISCENNISILNQEDGFFIYKRGFDGKLIAKVMSLKDAIDYYYEYRKNICFE